MCCQEKLLIIVVLVLIILFLYFRNNKELFTLNNLDVTNKINTTDVGSNYDTKMMNDPTYNYNPVAPECPDVADSNVKICKFNGDVTGKTCPGGMTKEGPYCYLDCSPEYLQGGLCWNK
jgi:hypothetical protein